MLDATHTDTCGNEQVLKLTLLVLTSLTFRQLGHFPSYNFSLIQYHAQLVMYQHNLCARHIVLFGSSKSRQFSTSRTLDLQSAAGNAVVTITAYCAVDLRQACKLSSIYKHRRTRTTLLDTPVEI